jgi:hypothetical protein
MVLSLVTLVGHLPLKVLFPSTAQMTLHHPLLASNNGVIFSVKKMTTTHSTTTLSTTVTVQDNSYLMVTRYLTDKVKVKVKLKPVQWLTII